MRIGSNLIDSILKEEETGTQTHRKDYAKIQGEDGYVQDRERNLRNSQPCDTLILDCQTLSCEKMNNLSITRTT